jgi:hypothetical protein
MLYEKYGLKLIRHFCALEGVVPLLQSPLQPFLSSQLPDTVSIQDASLEVLCLLRVLHALNRYWGTLYPGVEYVPILSQQVCIVDSGVSCDLSGGQILGVQVELLALLVAESLTSDAYTHSYVQVFV